MKLIYIANSIGSVFDSQVLTLLSYYSESAFFDETHLVMGYASNKEVNVLRKKKTNGIRIHFHKKYPNYPIFNLINKWSLFIAISKISNDYSDFFFHFRGELPAWYFLRFQRKKHISTNQMLIDIRGAGIEEILEFSNLPRLLKKLKILTYSRALRSLNKGYYISVVSKSLRNYLINNCGFDESYIMVNHCLVDKSFIYDNNKRITIRKELGINKNEILIVFVTGGYANWQNESVLKLIEGSGIRILNVSPNLYSSDSVINLFVPYDQVGQYLCAADVAIIWRELSIVNSVALPVKFAEYVTCGLPVISNQNIDFVYEFVTKYKSGRIIEDLSDLTIENLQSILKNYNRKVISELAYNIFNAEKISEKYFNIYSKMMSENDRNQKNLFNQ